MVVVLFKVLVYDSNQENLKFSHYLLWTYEDYILFNKQNGF